MTQRALIPALALTAVLATALAACDSAPPPADAPATTDQTPAAAAPVAAPGGLLAKDGVVLRAADGSAGPRLTFGEPEEDVIARANGVFGAAALARSANAECGAGPLTFAEWDNGLQLVFQDGKLAGWSARPNLPAGYASAAGIAFGKTVAELKAASPGFMLADSTVGPEFVLDGVRGITTGKGPQDTASLLWSGVDCQFR